MHHVAVATPPAAPVVTVDEAKAHLRVDHGDEDALIEAYLAAAISRLDGPEGILNRALSLQTLTATIEGFPEEPLTLRCEPIRAISMIMYVDPDGDALAVGATVYELTADGRLRLKYNQDWPEARDPRDPVTITYTAGYATLPPPLKAAILLMVGDLYANRETAVVGTVTQVIPMSATVQALIAPFRNLRA